MAGAQKPFFLLQISHLLNCRMRQETKHNLPKKMNYSSYYTPEQEVAHLYSSLFCDSYHIPGVYEDVHPLLEARNSDSSFQDECFFQDYISSMNWEEDAFYANSSHDRPVQPFNNWTDFDYFSNDDGYAEESAFHKTKDSFDWEEVHRGIYSGYYDNAEHQVACPDSPWSGYESWLGHASEEDINYFGRQEPRHESWLGHASEEDVNYFGRQEPRHAYDYNNRDEIGLYESLFGYWSFSVPKHQNVTAY